MGVLPKTDCVSPQQLTTGEKDSAACFDRPNPSSTVVVQKKYFLWQFDLDERMRLENSM